MVCYDENNSNRDLRILEKLNSGSAVKGPILDLSLGNFFLSMVIFLTIAMMTMRTKKVGVWKCGSSLAKTKTSEISFYWRSLLPSSPLNLVLIVSQIQFI